METTNGDHFGTRVRAARLRKRMTQDHLGFDAGLSKSFISDVENGKRSPSLASAMALAETLGLSLEFLAYGKAGIAS